MKIGHTALLAACVAVASVAAPAMPLDEFKAANTCRALVADPSSAINLQRPYALRYRAAPLRICMPDDTNHAWLAAVV